LAMALGFVGAAAGESFGIPQLLAQGSWGSAYYVVATLGFFALSLAGGGLLISRMVRSRYNLVHKSSPVAFLLFVMAAVTGLAIALGVSPMFGAFVAGLITRAPDGELAGAHRTIREFAFATFVPIYFGIVGLRLDLLREFDLGFLLLFGALACVVKWTSVYAGARAAGETGRGAANIAAAMNARGGPGIVLASVALDARIINQPLYAVLVMLAVITSLMAGTWLDYVVRRGWALR
ncbi:MAG: cation:proton antiporter, partial [Gemmatimonadales bacterium]